MSEVKRNFCITVEGQYYGAHDTTGAPVVKQYIAKFVLPSQEAALSIICKHLLDPYLRKHYADYARFRSHKITSVVSNGRPPDPAVLRMSFDDMSIADLFDFCILKHIFIDPYKHKDLEKCRIMIKEEWESRISQEKADKTSGLAREKTEADDLLRMNDLPVAAEGAEINVNEQKIGMALKKGAPKAMIPAPVDELETAPLPPAAEDDLLG